KRVTTIEGLAASAGLHEGTLHPLQQAWIEVQVPQCGYCQSGMLMAAAALLQQTPNPTDRQIADNITNLCRCGTYPRVQKAIHILAERGAKAAPCAPPGRSEGARSPSGAQRAARRGQHERRPAVPKALAPPRGDSAQREGGNMKRRTFL